MVLMRILLKIARAILMQVISDIAKQIMDVEDNVRNPLDRFVQEVINGAWKGDGADRFVEEIQSEALPLVTQLVESVTQINTNLRTGLEIMDNADTRTRQIVENLTSQFEGI